GDQAQVVGGGRGVDSDISGGGVADDDFGETVLEGAEAVGGQGQCSASSTEAYGRARRAGLDREHACRLEGSLRTGQVGGIDVEDDVSSLARIGVVANFAHVGGSPAPIRIEIDSAAAPDPGEGDRSVF